MNVDGKRKMSYNALTFTYLHDSLKTNKKIKYLFWSKNQVYWYCFKVKEHSKLHIFLKKIRNWVLVSMLLKSVTNLKNPFLVKKVAYIKGYFLLTRAFVNLERCCFLKYHVILQWRPHHRQKSSHVWGLLDGCVLCKCSSFWLGVELIFEVPWFYNE